MIGIHVQRTVSRILAPIAVVLATALLIAPPAAAAPAAATAAAPAAGPVQWSISPAVGKNRETRQYFIYTISPGSTLTDYAQVSNLGTRPITLNLYATDAFNTTDGAFSLLTHDQKPTGLGSWITTKSSKVTVAAGKQVRVPFQLKVPVDATPGDHAAGIVASQLVAATGPNNAKVTVDARVGARVYVRVIGQLNPALTVDQLTVSYNGAGYPFGGHSAQVDYRVTNTGNVELGGQGTVDLSAPFGLGVGSPQAVSVPALLPGSSFAGSVTVPGALPVIRLSAALHLQPTGQAGLQAVDVAAVDQSATVWAIPWLILGVIVLALLAWFLLRRARKTKSVMPSDDSPDNRADDNAADDGENSDLNFPFASESGSDASESGSDDVRVGPTIS